MDYILYHSTPSKIDKFVKGFSGSHTDHGLFGIGIYFFNMENYVYGNYCYKCNVKIDNPLYINDYTAEELAELLDIDIDNISQGNRQGGDLHFVGQYVIPNITSHIKDKGFDAVVVKRAKAKAIEYCVFNPSNIQILGVTLKESNQHTEKRTTMKKQDNINESIEVGGVYKLKKLNLPNIFNTQDNFEVLEFLNEKTVLCINTETRERFVFLTQYLVDPENGEDTFDGIRVVEGLDKLDAVMHPMNLTFWKDIKEDAMASTAAAMPALSAGGSGMAMGPTPTATGGARVNGIPVMGQSIMSLIRDKKKKKKNKKHEALDMDNIIDVKPLEMIEQVEDTFVPGDILVTVYQTNREKMKIFVYYTNPEDQVLDHTLKIQFLNEITDEVLDEVIEENLTTQDVLDRLNGIFGQDIYEDFHEEYDSITDLLAKQLDRLNFQYADTKDIIYKKEGAYKYLIKFDNEQGLLKFKIIQGENIVEDKEWKLDSAEDVEPIFSKIEEMYHNYGI